MEGMSSDDENDSLSSDEEGEHNVENFRAVLLCASCVQSTLARFPTTKSCVRCL